jgi:hypothetical protein
MRDTSLWKVDEPDYEWCRSLDELVDLLTNRGPGKYRVEKWSVKDPIDAVPTTVEIQRWLADELADRMVDDPDRAVDAPDVIAYIEMLRAAVAAAINQPEPCEIADTFTVEVSGARVSVCYTSEEV